MKKIGIFLMFAFLFAIASCTKVEDIEFSFSKNEVELQIGETYEIEYTLSNMDLEIEYSYSGDGIIALEDGIVTALSEGEVIVTGKVVDYDITSTIKIVVTPKEDEEIRVSSISIEGNNFGIVGDEITLTASVLPENATNKEVLWESSDEEVATVKDGVVTLLKAGTVTITATADTKKDTIEITVNEKVVLVDEISISGSKEGVVGEEITLTASVLPENATNKEVLWESSDEEVATVKDGVVTLLKAGTVTITATAGDKSDSIEITIVEPAVEIEDIEIIGANEGFVGDDIQLEVKVLPEGAENQEINWELNASAFAINDNGLLTLMHKGTLILTVTVGDISKTHEIVIKEAVAKIGDNKFETIEDAILEAEDNDTIEILKDINEKFTINKSNLNLKGVNQNITLTNVITLSTNIENIKIENLTFTGNAQITKVGTLKGFTFENNIIFDTNLEPSQYAPNSRIDVNAIIRLYTGSGANQVGDITITNNKFYNIKSDIISIDRTMANTEINISNNEFKNFGVGAIRFDGGYNNGTYNIKSNNFENDELSAYSAIIFRAYAPNDGIQSINIEDNTFVNIGNLEFSDDTSSDYPKSAVIGFSTFNTADVEIIISGNLFIHTVNSIHQRGGAEKWTSLIKNNTFKESLGYVYYENRGAATYENNVFLDRLGDAVEESRINQTVTDGEDVVYSLLLEISEPELESMIIVGEDEAEVSDEITLSLEYLPPYFVLENVVWSSSDENIATVVDGVVKLLDVGSVTITATYEDVVATFDITVSEKIAAYINDLGYATIQEAIDNANSGETINVNRGTFDEILTIDKPITLVGHPNNLSVLTNVINIEKDLEDITIKGFTFKDDFQVISTGTLKGFTFTNNIVKDTNLEGQYLPTSRVNVPAIIQLYSLAGTNIFGDINITNNIFENIKSDIISIDRTMIDEEINILNNEFINFTIGAIRFDGGYNNGTYNIKNNSFENTDVVSEAAIYFRAYAPNSGVQIINIEENTFVNMGNKNNNPVTNHPASAVIATSIFNENEVEMNILNNEFINPHNTLHMRSGGLFGKDKWNITIKENIIVNPTGYILYETESRTTFETNQVVDDNGLELELEAIESSSMRQINVKKDAKTYFVHYYTYNDETKTYDFVEESYEGFAGDKVVINPEEKLGYKTELDVYEGIIPEDGYLVIEIVYEKMSGTFTYELVLNGGNMLYASRDDMVNDFLSDYNAYGGTSYTVDTLPMGAWTNINIHTFFFDELYRDKWLWMAKYLGEVGSSTNAPAARQIVQSPTANHFDGVNGNYRYAFSYEVRGFIKGEKFTNNANWQSADYSLRELQHGFWDTLIAERQNTVFLNTEEIEILPTTVYLENFKFIGWYDNPEFEGEPYTEITEPMTLYANFEELNPVEYLTINNEVDEMLKGDTHQLDIIITPEDAHNKTLLFYTNNPKVLTVTSEGLITAVNAGYAVIKVTNYNGTVEVVMDVQVYQNDDIELNFNEGYNGFVKVGDEFSLDVIGHGKINATKEFSLSVEDSNILELTNDNEFKALAAGTTNILVLDADTVIYTHKVIVQAELAETRVDELLALLANANNAVVNGLNVITYYTASQEWSDPRYESVNLFLFDDYEVDFDTYAADPADFSNRMMESVEFVLVHDTANLSGGLLNHGAFFSNPANRIGIHYTTGDYGILGILPDNYVGWHAGDGTGYSFSWNKTGVMATNDESPFIDISDDGYFTFNSEKTTVKAPTGRNGEILDRSYFTYQGPAWDIFDGEYVIATTHFATNQQARGVIGTRGGNERSIGIEMNVNRDGDIIDTVQRTAKLVANLLEENNLSNRRVIMHNTVDGKGDPYTLNNTVYNGTWYFDRFMEHVAIEREVLKNFSDATITFSSDSDLVSSTGRVVEMPEFTTEVEYTITVEIDGVSKSITLVSVIPGTNTWNQNYGFFTPTQAWAKKDYRN